MSVTVRPYQGGPAWEVDIRLQLPDGTKIRERKKSPVSSKSGTEKWGRERERAIILNGGRRKVTGEAHKATTSPTLESFRDRFMHGYAEAERLKPSGIQAKLSIFERHLIPQLGDVPLGDIDDERIQRLKADLIGRAPKTVNNVLSTLNKMLRVAVQWKVIDQMPCTIRLLKVPRSEREFHGFEDYERLVESARNVSPTTYVIVLLGGDAGLRLGEMLALAWDDLDLKRDPAHVVVRRSTWNGQEGTPKGGASRRIPLTSRLARALTGYRHLRGPKVLCFGDGNPLTMKVVQTAVRNAARNAGLTRRNVHVLRHTFCSHLAMRGAPARAIQILAGHQDLKTTEIYLHVSPTALEAAISVLDASRTPPE